MKSSIKHTSNGKQSKQPITEPHSAEPANALSREQLMQQIAALSDAVYEYVWIINQHGKVDEGSLLTLTKMLRANANELCELAT